MPRNNINLILWFSYRLLLILRFFLFAIKYFLNFASFWPFSLLFRSFVISFLIGGDHLLLIFLFFFVHFFLFFVYSIFKFRNPFRLHLVIGKKGAGKTTYLSRIGQSAIRSGVKVYSNFRLLGATYFDTSDIDSGTYSFEYGSVILIDEAGTVWDSRNYSKFSSCARDFFKYQRKLGLTVYLASQTSDVDIKIRILCDDILVFRCILNVFSFGRYYLNRICIVHPSADAEARITDDLVPVPLWSILMGGKPGRLMFLPRWISVFDTKERL